MVRPHPTAGRSEETVVRPHPTAARPEENVVRLYPIAGRPEDSEEADQEDEGKFFLMEERASTKVPRLEKAHRLRG